MLYLDSFPLVLTRRYTVLLMLSVSQSHYTSVSTAVGFPT